MKTSDDYPGVQVECFNTGKRRKKILKEIIIVPAGPKLFLITIAVVLLSVVLHYGYQGDTKILNAGQA